MDLIAACRSKCSIRFVCQSNFSGANLGLNFHTLGKWRRPAPRRFAQAHGWAGLPLLLAALGWSLGQTPQLTLAQHWFQQPRSVVLSHDDLVVAMLSASAACSAARLGVTVVVGFASGFFCPWLCGFVCLWFGAGCCTWLLPLSGIDCSRSVCGAPLSLTVPLTAL